MASDLHQLTVDELRDEARRRHISGVSDMRKEELIEALEDGGRDGGSEHGGQRQSRSDLEPQGDSKSLKYSQTIRSTEDEPERAGRSLVTRSHDVIRAWAEERGGVPATVESSWHGGRPGVLRFDFGGDDDRLQHIAWEDWFASFDERNLNFIYQEQRSDGHQSTFFRLDNPEREDA